MDALVSGERDIWGTVADALIGRRRLILGGVSSLLSTLRAVLVLSVLDPVWTEEVIGEIGERKGGSWVEGWRGVLEQCAEPGLCGVADWELGGCGFSACEWCGLGC
jgi:hypothetical protein